jgi:DNA-binding MarR family transcriptional regulator
MESERFVPFVLYTERISKNIKRLADSKMEPYGLRSAHIMCILQLAKSEKGLSSAELSRVCGVDKAFVSRITTELMEKNYISRDIGPKQGKYKTKCLLTENGKEIYNVINELLCDFISKINKNTTLKKLETFYEVLNTIDIELDDITNKEIDNK